MYYQKKTYSQGDDRQRPTEYQHHHQAGYQHQYSQQPGYQQQQNYRIDHDYRNGSNQDVRGAYSNGYQRHQYYNQSQDYRASNVSRSDTRGSYGNQGYCRPSSNTPSKNGHKQHHTPTKRSVYSHSNSNTPTKQKDIKPNSHSSTHDAETGLVSRKVVPTIVIEPPSNESELAPEQGGVHEKTLVPYEMSFEEENEQERPLDPGLSLSNDPETQKNDLLNEHTTHGTDSKTVYSELLSLEEVRAIPLPADPPLKRVADSGALQSVLPSPDEVIVITLPTDLPLKEEITPDADSVALLPSAEEGISDADSETVQPSTGEVIAIPPTAGLPLKEEITPDADSVALLPSVEEGISDADSVALLPSEEEGISDADSKTVQPSLPSTGEVIIITPQTDLTLKEERSNTDSKPVQLSLEEKAVPLLTDPPLEEKIMPEPENPLLEKAEELSLVQSLQEELCETPQCEISTKEEVTGPVNLDKITSEEQPISQRETALEQLHTDLTPKKEDFASLMVEENLSEPSSSQNEILELSSPELILELEAETDSPPQLQLVTDEVDLEPSLPETLPKGSAELNCPSIDENSSLPIKGTTKSPAKNMDEEITGKLDEMYITPTRKGRKSRILIDSTNIVESSSITYITRELRHKEASAEVVITPVRRSTRKKGTTTPGLQDISEETLRKAKVISNPFLKT